APARGATSRSGATRTGREVETGASEPEVSRQLRSGRRTRRTARGSAGSDPGRGLARATQAGSRDVDAGHVHRACRRYASFTRTVRSADHALSDRSEAIQRPVSFGSTPICELLR